VTGLLTAALLMRPAVHTCMLMWLVTGWPFMIWLACGMAMACLAIIWAFKTVAAALA
jgi:hypothetical protein